MLACFILSVLFKISPNYIDLEFLYSFGYAIPNAEGVFEIPFIDRMGFVFVICVFFMFFISIYENRNGVIPNGLEVDASMFRPTAAFTVGALIVIGVVAAMYGIYW